MWFSEEKGYGFIRRDDNGEDIFVHYSGIDLPLGRRNLRQDQIVEFDVAIDEAKQKPIATNVKVISK